MGILITEYYQNKEFKKRNRTRSTNWQLRRTNILISFLQYAEFRQVKRLKDINNNIYSAYINQLHRKNLSLTTIERYKKILRQDLLSHFLIKTDSK